MGACGYHFTSKAISRSDGRSAVKHVAYIAAENFQREETGEGCNYRRKRGVEAVFHYAPKAAPAWAQEVESGWNAVEAIERRKNSTLALDYIAAFPHQLDATQRAFILKDFLREEFQRRGFPFHRIEIDLARDIAAGEEGRHGGQQIGAAIQRANAGRAKHFVA